MPDEPMTAEELQKSQAVAAAGGEAAIAAPADRRQEDTARAMRAERDRVDAKLSDEEVDDIASKFIEKLQEVGAFDPPPEPVQGPANQAPPAPSEPASSPAEPAQPAPAAPVKLTFADRYMGH